MRARAASIIAVVIGLFFVHVTRAEIVTNLSLGGGYQGNLFNDSISVGESYSFVGGDIEFYPSASTRITAHGRYNAYTSTRDLSNFSGGASIVIIPTSESSAWSVLFAGQLSYRTFGKFYQLYDQTDVGGGSTIGYRLTPSLLLKARASYGRITYTNADFGSNRGSKIVAGVNLTPFGSNALALELGHSWRTYDLAALPTSGTHRSFGDDAGDRQTYASTGLSLRYSRPLGARTGLSVSLGQRRLHLDDAIAIPGYSIDYLSPWRELWDGTSISTVVKHHFPKQVTVEIGAAYYDKAFVDVVEFDDLLGESYWLSSREDNFATFQISIARPVSMQNNSLITPNLSVTYAHNQSTLDYYDYGDLSVFLSLNMKF